MLCKFVTFHDIIDFLLEYFVNINIHIFSLEIPSCIHVTESVISSYDYKAAYLLHTGYQELKTTSNVNNSKYM